MPWSEPLFSPMLSLFNKFRALKPYKATMPWANDTLSDACSAAKSYDNANRIDTVSGAITN